jgi:hypothetical protein
MHYSVDEQRRGASHLTGRDSAANVALYALQRQVGAAVAVKPRDVEHELDRVAAQVVVRKRRLAADEHFVHLPETALERRGLRGPRRGEGVRMDLGQWKVPERKADPGAELPLDALDRAVRPARVRTLVVAVLDDQRCCRRAANVIQCLFQRLDHRLLLA